MADNQVRPGNNYSSGDLMVWNTFVGTPDKHGSCSICKESINIVNYRVIHMSGKLDSQPVCLSCYNGFTSDKDGSKTKIVIEWISQNFPYDGEKSIILYMKYLRYTCLMNMNYITSADFNIIVKSFGYNVDESTCWFKIATDSPHE